MDTLNAHFATQCMLTIFRSVASSLIIIIKPPEGRSKACYDCLFCVTNRRVDHSSEPVMINDFGLQTTFSPASFGPVQCLTIYGGLTSSLSELVV
jgi:hypothetical protein